MTGSRRSRKETAPAAVVISAEWTVTSAKLWTGQAVDARSLALCYCGNEGVPKNIPSTESPYNPATALLGLCLKGWHLGLTATDKGVLSPLCLVTTPALQEDHLRARWREVERSRVPTIMLLLLLRNGGQSWVCV